jgi:phage-related protein
VADKALSLDLTINVSEKVFHRVKKYGFGDGYEQIQKDGINSRSTEYEITTKPLSSSDASTLKTNLDSVATGDYFVATLSPFSTTSKRYRLKNGSYTEQLLPSTARHIFTFTLQEAFAP